MIEQINMRAEKPSKPYDVRCDRANPILGNHAGKRLPRDEAISAFGTWLADAYHGRDPKLLAEIERLRGIHEMFGKLRLFCWCKPLPCHTDLIAEMLVIEGFLHRCEAGHINRCTSYITTKCECCGCWLCEEHTQHA